MLKNVYFDHDGGIDDLVSLFLLLQMDHVKLIGVAAVNADSYLLPSVAASRKIIARFGHGKKITVAASNARAVHPFPKEWRLAAYFENSLPLLNEHPEVKTKLVKEAAYLDLIHKLTAALEPVTLLFTGPLTDLALALEAKPAISQKIERLIWMGGTFLKKGNVEEPDSDGTQEWNAFWDPFAVKTVFEANIKIDLVGLESTNNIPLTPEIRQHWAFERKFIGLDFIGNSYACVPELNLFATNSTYYLWDVLTTCYFYDHSFVKTKEITCDVKTKAPCDGRTFLTANGRPVTLIYDVDRKRFFKLIDDLAKKAN